MTAAAATNWAYHPSRGGAVYLPTDGSREISGPSLERPVGQGRVRENALVPASEVIRALPTAVSGFAKAVGVDLGLTPWRLWWRATTTQIADARAASELFSYSPLLGLGQVMTWDDTSAEAFLPPLVVLPSTGEVGSVWTREGTIVTPEDLSFSYTLKGSLQPATDPAYGGRNCAVSRLELTRGDQPAEIERLVFCPGAGLVDRLAGDSVRGASSDPTLPAPSTRQPPSPVWTPATWALSDTAVASVPWPDPADLKPIGSKTPAVTAGGTFVVVRGGGFDVSGLQTERREPPPGLDGATGRAGAQRHHGR